MRVTSELSLNHSEVDSICSSTQWIVDAVCEGIAQKVKCHLTQSGINPDLCEDIEKACIPGNVFSKLNSRYNRESYYQKHFNYVVRIKILLFKMYRKLIFIIRNQNKYVWEKNGIGKL